MANEGKTAGKVDSSRPSPNVRNDTNAVLATVFLNLFCILPFNLNTSFANNAITGMEEFFCNNSSECSKGVFVRVWPIYSSITISTGVVLSSFVIPMLSNRFGRKPTLLAFPLLMICGESVQVLAASLPRLGSQWTWTLLCVGRFICGLAGAIPFTLSPVFICEISSDRIRGTLGSVIAIFGAIGSFLGTMLGYEKVLGGRGTWSLLYLLLSVYIGGSFVVIWLLKESPTFLIWKQLNTHANSSSRHLIDDEATRKSLRFYRGTSEDFDTVRRDVQSMGLRMSGFQFVKLFTEPSVRLQTLLTLAIAISATPAIIVYSYSNLVLTGAKIDPTTAGLLAIALEFIAFVVNVVCIFTVDKFNRRPIFLGTVWGSCLCLAVMTLLQAFLDRYDSSVLSGCFALVLVSEHILVNIGPRCLFYVLVPELFPFQFRATGKAFGNQMFFLLPTVPYLPLPYLLSIGHGWVSYAILATAIGLSAAFSSWKLPETQGKSPADIFDEMNR